MPMILYKTHVIILRNKLLKGDNYGIDKDIVGSIEFLEVLGLEGSTYLLKGPNGEQVKLNQSEINEEDEFEIGEEYSFFIYPNRSGELFATQNMPDITKDKYDFAKVLKQIEMVQE